MGGESFEVEDNPAENLERRGAGIMEWGGKHGRGTRSTYQVQGPPNPLIQCEGERVGNRADLGNCGPVK